MSGSPEVFGENNVEAEAVFTAMNITNIVNPPTSKKRKAEERTVDPSKTLTAAAKDSVTVKDRFDSVKLNNGIRLLQAVKVGDPVNMGEQYSNMLRHCKRQLEEDDPDPDSRDLDLESVYNYLAWAIHPQDQDCHSEPTPQAQRILRTLLHNLSSKIINLGCLEQRKHVARKLALVKANLEGIEVKTTSKKKKTDKDRPASNNPLSITRPMLDPFKTAENSQSSSDEDTMSPK
ncbi:hypothetical protein K493DRAFT_311719 [Basidiobolus meristosporus CBS 931.73]|uniref:Uncharacterized protein n=1 Tax=Basidiobolus meristosporus CBS 931.73 TaxID=1314790 RepID=A0A1Y1YZ71_9FUNG|nr:hypothetical protein K493DRAFT_311719 [Basidiobolus meristosporus CBS 931.73]|eukprot:ORY03348.1 hypothetical protein K493DRAFT_311719 [Basidiobolus meristosporus CBS 931.73]